MNEIRILGILVRERSKAALEVQHVLTKYGCSIRTRLGLNELGMVHCDDCGLILLELIGDPAECLRLENALWAIDGVKLQRMIF